LRGEQWQHDDVALAPQPDAVGKQHAKKHRQHLADVRRQQIA
jgi:hypothetical protein